MVTQNDSNQIKTKTTTKSINTKKKKAKDWSFYVIIISLIIIAIPTSFLGYHIIQARLQTGQPLFGDRFKGDLSKKILPEHLDSLTTTVMENPNVESVNFTITAATLRASVKAKPEVDKALYDEIVDSIYASVDSLLPITDYFTQTSTEKMYDIEINLYNTLTSTEETPFVNFMLSKSSAKEELIKQYISESSNPEFVEELLEFEKQREEQANENANETDKDVASES